MSAQKTVAFANSTWMCTRQGSPSKATCKNKTTSQQEQYVQKRKYTRRDAICYSITAAAVTFLAPLEETQAANSATGRTIVNGILSGYGLPTLSDVSGFTPLLEQYGQLVVGFQYPSAWIVTRNIPPATDSAGLSQANGRMSLGSANVPVEGRSSGLTASDYRKAEGLSFYVSSVPKGVKNVTDLNSIFIAQLVTPGDATGALPVVKVVADKIDDDGYRVIDTKYESITVSGYSVARRGRTRAIVLADGKMYALTAGCSDVRWKKIVDTIDTSLSSFQVFRI